MKKATAIVGAFLTTIAIWFVTTQALVIAITTILVFFFSAPESVIDGGTEVAIIGAAAIGALAGRIAYKTLLR